MIIEKRPTDGSSPYKKEKHQVFFGNPAFAFLLTDPMLP